MADIITLSRIIFAFALLFCEPFGVEFYILFSFAGISDIFDGIVARATKKVSKRGAIFDTVADLLTFVFVLCKIHTAIDFDVVIIVLVALISAIKAVGFSLCAIKKIQPPHTVLLKITGGILFVCVYIIPLIDSKILLYAITFFALLASVDECVRIFLRCYGRK